MNKNYLYPSFDTIAGSGENGAIVHYRAKKENCRTINKKDIFLCDSGGQYKYGTTDVTRTICFSKSSQNIKNIFTKVLKGHIAVACSNLSKDDTGKKIDKKARKFLNESNLDYAHGTGHGVGFFLNVHEGPQSISKFNKIKIKEGMILSNEPGYYKKNKFGIRIENLVVVKKVKKKLVFENLTMAPIEKDLINFKLLTQAEQNYLFKYHLDVYIKISKYLNFEEKKWLASFI
jgi:Xaa-Pro aminopeptidase